jgi:hypothetical protein
MRYEVRHRHNPADIGARATGKHSAFSTSNLDNLLALGLDHKQFAVDPTEAMKTIQSAFPPPAMLTPEQAAGRRYRVRTIVAEFAATAWSWHRSRSEPAA